MLVITAFRNDAGFVAALDKVPIDLASVIICLPLLIDLLIACNLLP